MWTRRPAPPLAALVDHLWLYAGAAEPVRERVLPGGHVGIIIDLIGDRCGCGDATGARWTEVDGPLVSGLQTAPITIARGGLERVAGIVFAPGGAAALLGVPAHALCDVHVSLETLWGSSALALRDRVAAAAGPAAAFDLIEAALRARLSGDTAVHPAARRAAAVLAGAAPPAIDALAGELGLSARRLADVFAAAVGVTPKRYARLWRFRRVLAAAHRTARVDWAALAVDVGYHDQAHLGHEFRAFAAMSPGEYLARRGPFLNHVG